MEAAVIATVETREVGDRTHRSIATHIGTPDAPVMAAMVEFLRMDLRGGEAQP